MGIDPHNRVMEGFRVRANVQQYFGRCKRRIERRLDKTNFAGTSPVLSGSSIRYEVANRTRAVAAGGIGMIHTMVDYLGLDKMINRSVNVLKIYLPYSESDHVLNIAYNLHSPVCITCVYMCLFKIDSPVIIIYII